MHNNFNDPLAAKRLEMLREVVPTMRARRPNSQQSCWKSRQRKRRREWEYSCFHCRLASTDSIKVKEPRHKCLNEPETSLDDQLAVRDATFATRGALRPQREYDIITIYSCPTAKSV